ncbi:DEAD/DEAH box helicase [Actinocatenispora comari]|uniref:Helicase SNF2 n=1 Tax=Actinocatenispora comari TaxID=2807577 RepID=A0A8J4AGN3_9ACTN|nr:DEAD/DEAH box helicase [Actinocatenispora comari]GIL29322.1 helicase SNF2 [Actinocatenispora comari]
MGDHAVHATFLPGDPARRGTFAFWRSDGRISDTNSEFVVAQSAYGRIRRHRTPARILPIDAAVRRLLDGDDDTDSARAWRAVVLSGLGQLAAGRLAPGRSATGTAAWRVLPDPAATDWLHRCAAAMPPEAYAAPTTGAGRALLRTPASLITACWDALADTLARTAADGSPVAAYAGDEPLPAEPYRRLLTAIDTELAGSVRLVLRLCLPTPAEQGVREQGVPARDVPAPDVAAAADGASAPDGAAGNGFSVALAMRSAGDPSLVVELARLWSAPSEVLDRFGADAETDVLLALRRAARVWPPLSAALAEHAPSALPLADEDVDGLFEAAEALGTAGADVLWPAELTDHSPRLAATTKRPAATGPAAFGLTDLLDFQWQATLDGTALTEDELTALAEAKRPLIRLRGRWVRVDRSLVARLRRRRQRVGGAQALAAALTGTLSTADGEVPFTPDRPLAELVERLAGAGSEVPPPDGLDATLRPYQRRGLGWLAAMTGTGLGGCLADDMGLGKTLQIIALHLHRHTLHCGPTLVCCPASLLGNWEREVHRFAPGVAVRRFHGSDRDLGALAGDEIVLASYGVLRADTATLAGARWGLVVADEAQAAKNPLSRTAKALRAVPAAARIALTGTPVENRLTDLWSIVDWTTPGLLGPLADFRRRIANPVERYADADATRRLATLTRPFLLRRRKSDPGIAPELPPKTETDVLVPLTAEQTTLYEAVVRDTMAEIEAAEGVARRGLVLKLLTALKQICNHPAQYLGEPGPLAGRSGKLTALDELLDVILAEGESVLVFSQYVQLCRLLERHLADRGVDTLLLHGGVGVRQREERVRRFDEGGAPVFLLSLKAAGVGLNLTRASHVIHVDRWWNPAVEDQATDRAYRIGQDRPVQVHRLVTEHTVEDRVAKLIADKRALADAVVGSGETWLTELSDTELADLVALS